MLCDQFQEYSAAECDCDIHKMHPFKSLTILLLDCWQREYDERPYKHFQISKHFFEKRMRRVFTEQDWLVLIDYLEKRKPKRLKICNIDMPNFEDVNSINRFIKGLENAETVQLKNVSLSTKFLFELQKCITPSKMKNLDLSQNELTSDHLIYLRCILIQSYTLNFLNVESCSINENTFPILADGIHKSRSIRGINISRPCPMSSVSIFESRKYMNLLTQLVWQNKLTSLILRQSNLNGHDMESLSEYLDSESSQLLHLDLQSNNISSHGTDSLFTVLTKNKTLRKLNLSANNLGSRGGMVIARLISNTCLESLDITHNQIGSEAMFELLIEIKKPIDLKSINMYGNEFDHKTAAILKRLLRANVLNQNEIDVTYTWDYSKDELCVVPHFKEGRINI